ncbi:MAG: hypothetical protein MJE66_15925, partial [Proteobacteria bacterium]|nr:hypothetical protein [Pseudomonadota bacterium]
MLAVCRSILRGIALLLVTVATAQATPIVLTFDEIAPQVFDELEIAGVSLSTSDGVYGANHPWDWSQYLEGRVLEAPTDQLLILDFEVPTTVVEFGLLLPFSLDDEPAIVSVEFFAADLASLGTDLLALEPGTDEALVQWDGAHVSRAVISAESLLPTFLIDNLTYLDILENRVEVVAPPGADGAVGGPGLPGGSGGDGGAA